MFRHSREQLISHEKCPATQKVSQSLIIAKKSLLRRAAPYVTFLWKYSPRVAKISKSYSSIFSFWNLNVLEIIKVTSKNCLPKWSFRLQLVHLNFKISEVCRRPRLTLPHSFSTKVDIDSNLRPPQYS